MPVEPDDDEPTQETEQGLTIPVPDRKTVDDALAAIARDQVPSRPRRRKRRT